MTSIPVRSLSRGSIPRRRTPWRSSPRRSAAGFAIAAGLILALAACVGGPSLSVEPAGSISASPSLPASASPSLPASASPSLPASASPSTLASASPSTLASASPSTRASSPPSASAAPTSRVTASPVTSPTASPPRVGVLGVSGRVLAGPTCPVMRIPPDPNCADRPVAGAVLVVTDDSGREVARTASSSTGDFSIELSAGHYRLTPQPVAGLMGTAAPVEFTIAPSGPAVTLQISYDTGIR